jgi:6-phosphofructokinase
MPDGSPSIQASPEAPTRFLIPEIPPAEDEPSASAASARRCVSRWLRATGKKTRAAVLGHLRGGAPTGFDRVLTTRFGGGGRARPLP